jgi:signal transduction histidine kinase
MNLRSTSEFPTICPKRSPAGRLGVFRAGVWRLATSWRFLGGSGGRKISGFDGAIIADMSAVTHSERIAASPAARLTKVALEQTALSGFSEMLRVVGDLTNADCCLLWQEVPGSDLTASPPRGELYILADWFRDGSSWSERNLSLDSVTGKAILRNTPVDLPDVDREPVLGGHLARFFHITGMRAFCAVPVAFLDGKRGSINVYRKSTESFEPQFALVQELAELIPALYKSILNKVSLDLLSSVNHLFAAAEREASENALSHERVRKVIADVAGLVQRTFQSVEVSIFLEDPVASPGRFEMLATTCQEFVYKDTCEREDAGFTPWVIKSRKPLQIFDLSRWEDEREHIIQRCRGIKWKDPADLLPAARKILNLSAEKPLQPLSFMAQPVVVGDSALGAIRVCAAAKAPYYYGTLELELLGLIASELGHYWKILLERRAAAAENISWKALVSGISEANLSVVSEFAGTPDLLRVFTKTLMAASPAFSESVAMSVRLYDAGRDDLYFCALHGDAWDAGTAAEIQARKSRRFPIHPPGPMSKGAEVFLDPELKVKVVERLLTEEEHPTFPETKWMIIAPISDGERTVGVLDIRGLKEARYPAHSAAIAQLLGLQIGLYHSLVTHHVGLRKAYSNLGHQLKSPLNTAQGRIAKALEGRQPGSELRMLLDAARSALRRVRRVSTDIRLFAELEERGEIPVRPAPVPVDALVDKLREIAGDHQALVEPVRRLEFKIQEKTFTHTRSRRVIVDLLLFEHAISNLCDNALKYSASGKTILIYGSSGPDGSFRVAVRSEGIPARRHEIDKWTIRGWRSEEAESADADGTGLGLYIVKHIMQAHKGELSIRALGDPSMSEVGLVFRYHD